MFYELTYLKHYLIPNLSVRQIYCVNTIIVNAFKYLLVFLGYFYAFKFFFSGFLAVLFLIEHAWSACQYAASLVCKIIGFLLIFMFEGCFLRHFSRRLKLQVCKTTAY